MMNVKEEKHFESSIEQLIDYVKAIKESLQVFINKIDHESGRLEWPEVLDLFSSVCGQMNTLMRFAWKNRSIFSGNKAILPLLLSPDKDDDLIQLTEGRVPVVNHEMVPNYLRTRPDPEVEDAEAALKTKLMPFINHDASTRNKIIYVEAVNKIVNTFNKITSNVERYMTSMKQQSWTDDKKQLYSRSETLDLITAVSLGAGLRPGSTAIPGISSPGPVVGNVKGLGPKAPELRTNIINSNI